jgi:hypothetical protein
MKLQLVGHLAIHAPFAEQRAQPFQKLMKTGIHQDSP